MIKAEIIKDSVSAANIRITTFVLTYPRFIHAEFMTHRVFSRNASSSRAIPVSKFVEAIKNEPAMPVAFSKNCKGMQAREDIKDQSQAESVWLEARDAMIKYVEKLSELGVHKQHANRLLEPFQHMTVVATATDFANFFALRTHQDAQPEFRELATQMYKLFSSNNPKKMKDGEWHLPFITNEEFEDYRISSLLRMSVARCARVSYNNHDGTDNSLQKDSELYSRLVGNAPIHASPAEHQAMATSDPTIRSGNFRGWIQYRKTLLNENILSYPGNG